MADMGGGGSFLKMMLFLRLPRDEPLNMSEPLDRSAVKQRMGIIYVLNVEFPFLRREILNIVRT